MCSCCLLRPYSPRQPTPRPGPHTTPQHPRQSHDASMFFSSSLKVSALCFIHAYTEPEILYNYDILFFWGGILTSFPLYKTRGNHFISRKTILWSHCFTLSHTEDRLFFSFVCGSLRCFFFFTPDSSTRFHFSFAPFKCLSPSFSHFSFTVYFHVTRSSYCQRISKEGRNVSEKRHQCK